MKRLDGNILPLRQFNDCDCIPKKAEESAYRRVQSAKNRMWQSGLYCLILAHFAAFDFW